MLTRQELQEMRTLTQRLQAASVSREDWSNLAALALICEGDPIVLEIAAHGLDTFIAVAEPLYRNHAFHYQDYQRIYARVCEASLRHRRDLVLQ